jgi:hypothetical protein
MCGGKEEAANRRRGELSTCIAEKVRCRADRHSKEKQGFTSEADTGRTGVRRRCDLTHLHRRRHSGRVLEEKCQPSELYSRWRCEFIRCLNKYDDENRCSDGDSVPLCTNLGHG